MSLSESVASVSDGLHLDLGHTIIVSTVSLGQDTLTSSCSLPGTIFVVRKLCHVELSQSLSLLNEWISLRLSQTLPSLAQQF